MSINHETFHQNQHNMQSTRAKTRWVRQIVTPAAVLSDLILNLNAILNFAVKLRANTRISSNVQDGGEHETASKAWAL